MISYAQNFEDVLLERAFKGQVGGFYIDVGAWEPVVDSVTKHFYDKGWRGINVEPIPAYHRKLLEARERDVNLNVALLDKIGHARMYAIPDSGLSTFERDHAESHRTAGFEVNEHGVNVSTLAAICSEYAAQTTIDFLKIDTEGTELLVLRGGDWTRFRPRIVVIEATRPLSQEVSYAESEVFLLQQGYRFAYFDGLNRFYSVADEPALLERLAVPPNVFDSFMTYRTAQLERKVDELNARLVATEARLKSVTGKAERFDRLGNTLAGKILRRLV